MLNFSTYLFKNLNIDFYIKKQIKRMILYLPGRYIIIYIMYNIYLSYESLMEIM